MSKLDQLLMTENVCWQKMFASFDLSLQPHYRTSKMQIALRLLWCTGWSLGNEIFLLRKWWIDASMKYVHIKSFRIVIIDLPWPIYTFKYHLYKNAICSTRSPLSVDLCALYTLYLVFVSFDPFELSASTNHQSIFSDWYSASYETLCVDMIYEF